MVCIWSVLIGMFNSLLCETVNTCLFIHNMSFFRNESVWITVVLC